MQTVHAQARPSGFPDPWPLLRRMTVLGLDPDDIADSDPLLYYELRALCMRCANRAACAHDLADEGADPGWQNWRDYCPDATTLSMLSAINGCRAQHG